MPSITHNQTLVASFSISAKDSSGNFTVSGTITNNATYSRTGCRLAISLTSSTSGFNWHIGPYSLGPGASNGTSVTVSSGNTSSQTVWIYLLQGSGQAGTGGTYTVSGYVDPTPTFVKKTLSISPTTQIMGNALSISDSGGTGVTSTTHTWYAGNTSGSFDTGSWIVPTSSFEPLCPNAESISATFRTYSSGAGGSGYSDKTVTLRVPSDYVPTATHEAVYINPENNSLVAGISSLRIELTPSLLPEGLNSASISSTQLLSVTSSNPAITTSTFTKSGNNYTSGILPTLSGAPSYTIKLTFRITDSRGRTSDYTTPQEYRVTNFIPPYCQITNLHRDTSATATLNVTITSPSAATLAKVKVGNGTPVDVLNSLVSTSTGYTLEYHITGLQSGEQYPITFYYKDTNMQTYGEAEYAYTQLLSTMAMPISLFDNGSRLAASFGEECADDYGQDVVINFAKDAYIRYMNGNTAVIDKAEYIFNPCPFAIGGIYISTASSNPATIWPWTTWQAIGQGRVLIGVGTGTDSNGDTLTVSGGDEDGEYNHTLTVSEMPSHHHTWYPGYSKEVQLLTGGEPVKEDNLRNGQDTSDIGGDGAHNNIQPYLGVYMWERLS